MFINTSKFGKIEIEKERILTFSEGLIGFDHVKQYVLFDMAEESPLKWLQAVDDPDLCFVIVDPTIFKPEYSVEVSKEDLENLGAVTSEELGSVALVTVHDDAKNLTANIRGPIVINFKTRLAKQIIHQDQSQSLRYNIFQFDESSVESEQVALEG